MMWNEKTNYVWELSDSILARGNGPVVVIEVYLDESGTHDGSQIVTVGAAWADKGTWSAWTEEWNTAKEPIKIHHSVDCHNREGEWNGWGKDPRDEYVLRILPVIKRSKICGTIAGLDKQALRISLKSRPDVFTWIGDLYLVSLQWAVNSVVRRLSALGHTEAAFFHETNQYVSGASEVFSICKRKAAENGFSFSFGFDGKDKYVPLQCADILAYEGNHQLRRMGKIRKPLDAIADGSGRIAFTTYDASEVSEMAQLLIREYDSRAS